MRRTLAVLFTAAPFVAAAVAALGARREHANALDGGRRDVGSAPRDRRDAGKGRRPRREHGVRAGDGRGNRRCGTARGARCLRRRGGRDRARGLCRGRRSAGAALAAHRDVSTPPHAPTSSRRRPTSGGVWGGQ